MVKLALSLQMMVCLCVFNFFFFALFFDMPFFIKDFLSGPFSVFTEFVTILLLFYVLCVFFWPRGIWDLSYPTRDRNHTACIGRRNHNHWTTSKSLICLVILLLLLWYPAMMYQVSSVQLSHSVVSDCSRPHGLKHARPPCPSPAPGVYSNSCPLTQ